MAGRPKSKGKQKLATVEHVATAVFIQATFPQIKPRNQRCWLQAYINGAYTPTHACEVAGVTRSTYQAWRNKDPLFAAAFEDAEEIVTQRLEREAYRRAMEGWEEPVFQKGELVGYIRKFDSQLLQFVLKKLKPEYRDKYAPSSLDPLVADITERLRTGMARARPGEIINVKPTAALPEHTDDSEEAH